jgi:hypothetical protein
MLWITSLVDIFNDRSTARPRAGGAQRERDRAGLRATPWPRPKHGTRPGPGAGIVGDRAGRSDGGAAQAENAAFRAGVTAAG